MFYKQVRLEDNDKNVRVAWVPERYAHVGKILSIKESDFGWSNGWLVTDVWTQLSEEYVREHERDHLTQRNASDV